MKQITKINLFIVFLYSTSCLFEKYNFPYFKYLLGSIIWFLPGLNISLLLEQIANSRIGQIKIILWSIIISLTFTPTVYYFIILSSLNTVSNNAKYFLIIILLSLVTYLCCLIMQQWKKYNVTIFNFQSFFTNKDLKFASLLFLIGIIPNFFLYRFIPEADPYTYLIKIQDFSKIGIIPIGEQRPMFITLFFTFSKVTGISPYWCFKVIIPLLSFAILLVFYKIAKKLFVDNYLIVFSSIIFLMFPVIAMEILIPRPQSIFLITFPITLYLISEIIKNKKMSEIYYLLFLLILNILSLKTHQFFFFSIFLNILALIIFTFPKIKKYPLEFFLIIFFICFSLYPWLKNLGFLSQLTNYFKYFTDVIIRPQWKLWFINSYKNIDGSEMGWPGFYSIFYYGYNLGIVFPIIIIILIVKKIKIQLLLKDNWIYFISFCIFISIAEVFPRIGLAFLPDRAWLFVALSFCFFIPLLLKSFSNVLSERFIKSFVFAIIIASFSVSWAITYAKQGWITKDEYNAAVWMKNNISKNTIIFTQMSLSPMQYFADRSFITDSRDIFLNEKQNIQIDDVSICKQQEKARANKINDLNNLKTYLFDVDSLKNPEDFRKKYTFVLNDFINNVKYINELSVICDPKKPIYVIYSYNKFSGLYSLRTWWNDANFKNANFEKFKKYPQIYNVNGVIIWQINN